jgi:repressor LexA
MFDANSYSELPALTKRQSEIFEFILSCIAKHDAPPTRIEIAKEFGFRSPNAAEDHLKALAKKGYIELKTGTSRGIQVNHLAANDSVHANASINANDNYQPGFAIIGDVAAGSPILAQENIQSHLSIDPSFFSDTPDYLLRVKGDSMIEMGIYEKDILAIKKSNQAVQDQVVVARIGDDVTVKRFRKNNNKVQLIAENKDYQPIEVDLKTEQFAIEGVVVGLIRQGGF